MIDTSPEALQDWADATRGTKFCDLFTALAAEKRAAQDVPDEYKYECEVWQDGNLVAEASSTSAQEVLKEADHYAAIYGQDGPVEVKFYARRALTRAAMDTSHG